MKNKSFWLYAVVTLSCGLFFSKEVAAESNWTNGETSLEIVPLNEDVPRIYSINNLNFGVHADTETHVYFKALNDLDIQILDARQDPTDWSLQLRIEPFKNNDGQSLAAGTMIIGKGTFETVSTESSLDLSGKVYQENLDVNDYRTLISSSGEHKRGWLTYHVPKEEIKLEFDKNTVTGNYQSVSHWRLINANLNKK